MNEVDKLVAVMDIIRRVERDRKLEHLYVSCNVYGYKRNGKWYESDGIDTWEVTQNESV